MARGRGSVECRIGTQRRAWPARFTCSLINTPFCATRRSVPNLARLWLGANWVKL